MEPDKLTNEDSAYEAIVRNKDVVGTVERFRDVVKMWTDNAMYVVLGLENQMRVHYAMPVRTMMYDAMNYSEQIKRKSADVRNKNVSASEYLSGFGKEDKIYPVVTLVLYYSDEKWDGPTSLYDMMNISEEIKPLVPDYKINLVNIKEVDYTEFSDDEVKCFFKLMKQFEKGRNIGEVKTEVENSYVSRETLLAVGVAASSAELVKMATSYHMPEGDEESMLAIDEWVAEARIEGEKRGEKRGIKKGEKQGEKRGIKKGEKRGINRTLEVLSKINNGMTRESIVAEGYSEELVNEVMATMNR